MIRTLRSPDRSGEPVGTPRRRPGCRSVSGERIIATSGAPVAGSNSRASAPPSTISPVRLVGRSASPWSARFWRRPTACTWMSLACLPVSPPKSKRPTPSP